nr:MAG: hypothetical protein [Molluscum contagiosum virus]
MRRSRREQTCAHLAGEPQVAHDGGQSHDAQRRAVVLFQFCSTVSQSRQGTQKNARTPPVLAPCALVALAEHERRDAKACVWTHRTDTQCVVRRVAHKEQVSASEFGRLHTSVGVTTDHAQARTLGDGFRARQH